MVRKKTKGSAKRVAKKAVAKAPTRTARAKSARAKKGAKKARTTTTSHVKAAPALDVTAKAIDLLRSWSPSRYSKR